MYYLVINKKSGSYSKPLLEKIKNIAHKYFENNYQICYTKKINNNIYTPDINFKINQGDTIIAIGGDGTINICLNFIHKHKLNTKVSLGIIPKGTGNNMLLSLNLSKTLKKSFEIIKQKRYQKLQYGLINDKHAFFNCSIGFSAHLLKNRKFHSRNGYILDIITNFNYRPKVSTLKYDDKVIVEDFFHGYFINTTHYASVIPFIKYQADDGKLRFFHSKKQNIFKNINLIIKTIKGQDQVKIITSSKFILEPASNCFLEIDGDILDPFPSYKIEYAGIVEVICG